MMKKFLLSKSNKLLRFFSFIILLSVQTLPQAQTPTTTDTTANSVYFEFDNLSFFRNNEYFGKITEGYTLFGYWLEPKIAYAYQNKLKLSVGVHAHKYFGLAKFSSTKPYYQVAIKPSHKLTITLGNLDQEKDRLPTTILNSERLYTSPYQEGLDISYQGKYVETSNRIEWEDFLFHGEDKQEELNITSTSKLHVLKKKSLSVSLPLHVRVHHKGGQINKEPKQDLVMVANNAAGIESKSEFGKNIALSAQYLFCGYTNKASAKYSSYDNGLGHWVNVAVRAKKHHLSYAWWHADQYLSPEGERYLNTVSDIPEKPFAIKERTLSNVTYTFTSKWTDIADISSGIGGIYDHAEKNIDYYYWFTVAIAIDRKIDFLSNIGRF